MHKYGECFSPRLACLPAASAACCCSKQHSQLHRQTRSTSYLCLEASRHINAPAADEAIVTAGDDVAELYVRATLDSAGVAFDLPHSRVWAAAHEPSETAYSTLYTYIQKQIHQKQKQTEAYEQQHVAASRGDSDASQPAQTLAPRHCPRAGRPWRLQMARSLLLKYRHRTLVRVTA